MSRYPRPNLIPPSPPSLTFPEAAGARPGAGTPGTLEFKRAYFT
jgi:hypothetical protein